MSHQTAGKTNTPEHEQAKRCSTQPGGEHDQSIRLWPTHAEFDRTAGHIILDLAKGNARCEHDPFGNRQIPGERHRLDVERCHLQHGRRLPEMPKDHDHSQMHHPTRDERHFLAEGLAPAEFGEGQSHLPLRP